MADSFFYWVVAPGAMLLLSLVVLVTSVAVASLAWHIGNGILKGLGR